MRNSKLHDLLISNHHPLLFLYEKDVLRHMPIPDSVHSYKNDYFVVELEMGNMQLVGYSL